MYLQTEGIGGTLMLIFFLHSSPFSLLLGPFLFFYVRNTLTDRNRLTKHDLIHFIPFVFVAFDLTDYYQLPLEEKRRIIEQISGNMSAIMSVAHGRILSHYQYSLLRWFLWFGYLLLILNMLYKRRPGIIHGPKIPLSQYRVSYTWLLTLTLFFVAVVLTFLKVILDNHSGHNLLSSSDYLATPAFVLSMVIYFMACLSILMYPQILYGMPRLSAPMTDEIIAKDIPTYDPLPDADFSAVPDLRADSSNQDPFVRLADAIEQYIRDEKPYLDSDFSISTISQRFKVPQHHVHYCFSKIIQCGFPAYRNRLRVEYARELLASGHGRQLTIDAIGKQSGFSAKMNFYTAFKKETGMTPRQYLDSLHSDPSPGRS